MCTSDYVVEILSKAGWESARDMVMDEYFMTVRYRLFALKPASPPRKVDKTVGVTSNATQSTDQGQDSEPPQRAGRSGVCRASRGMHFQILP